MSQHHFKRFSERQGGSARTWATQTIQAALQFPHFGVSGFRRFGVWTRSLTVPLLFCTDVPDLKDIGGGRGHASLHRVGLLIARPNEN